MPSESQTVGAVALAIIAVVSRWLMESDSAQVPDRPRRVWCRRSGQPPQPLAFSVVTGVSLVLFVAGLAMTANYLVVRLLFLGAWGSAVIAAYMFLAILYHRTFWTIITGTVLLLVTFVVYLEFCPNLTLQPQDLTFGPGDSYIIRVTNHTSADLYADAFVLRLRQAFYSASDFKLTIEPKFLRPLEQQSGISKEKVADVFGLSGWDSDGDPLLIVYMYHLAPHDSRELDLKFDGDAIANVLPHITGQIMSYSELPLPIGSKGDIVTVPMGIEYSFSISRIFRCLLETDGTDSCISIPVLEKRKVGAPGCYYIAFVRGRQLPSQIANPNFNGSCILDNFKTHDFTIW